ncbi:MAG TPA: GxxExxY protein [Chitinophagaceae bacterium]|nr:GxxExxY protein [Chitinophagaceae bacterium]
MDCFTAKQRRLNALGGKILDSAISVHRELGPGLLESAYQKAMEKELEIRMIEYRSQVGIDLKYKDLSLGKGYIVDLLVEESIIVEIKSVSMLTPIFEAQLLTYLKLFDKNLGFLINFNTEMLKEGFNRIVYKF